MGEWLWRRAREGGKPGSWARHRVPHFASQRWSARDGDDKAELLVGVFFGAGCGSGVAVEKLAIRLGGFPAFQNTILCNQDETSDAIFLFYTLHHFWPKNKFG